MSTQLVTTTAIETQLAPFFRTGAITPTGTLSGFKAWCVANGHDYDDKVVRSAKSPESRLYKQQKCEARPVLRQIAAAIVSDTSRNVSKLELCTKKDKVTGERVLNGAVKITLHTPSKADMKAESGNAKLALEAKLAAALARLAELEAAQAAK